MSTSLTKDEIDKFLKIMPLQKPEIICTTYFKMVHKNSDDDDIVSSPLQYYTMANNLY